MLAIFITFDIDIDDPTNLMLLIVCYGNTVIKCWGKMTITHNISVDNGNLVVHGKTILKGVPENVVLTPDSGNGLATGAFIGATASHTKSLHVFPIGILE